MHRKHLRHLILVLSLLAAGCTQPAQKDPPPIDTAATARPAVPAAEVVKPEPSEPEVAAREFLLAMLSGDEAAVRRWSLPHAEIAMLWSSPAPPEAIAQARQYAEQLSFTRLQVGDVIQLPGGKTLTLDETHVNENRAQLMAPDAPIPFILVRGEERWRVDPSPLIASRKTVAAMMARREQRDWSADQKLLEKLGDEQAVGDYRIRIPQGYNPSNPAAAGPTRAFLWELPLRDDRTAADFSLILQALPAEVVAGKKLEDHFQDVVEAVKCKRDDWSATPPEYGQIDGRTFIRLHWTGIGKPVSRKALSGRKMQGFIYVSVEQQNAIIMVSQDVEPDAETTMPLLEAAALTLRK